MGLLLGASLTGDFLAEAEAFFYGESDFLGEALLESETGSEFRKNLGTVRESVLF